MKHQPNYESPTNSLAGRKAEPRPLHNSEDFAELSTRIVALPPSLDRLGTGCETASVDGGDSGGGGASGVGDRL